MRRSLATITLLFSLFAAAPVGMALFKLRPMPLGTAIFLHLFSAALCSLGFYLLTAQPPHGIRKKNIWWLFALAVCITMPFYGVAASLMIYVIQGIRGRRPPPVVSDEITVQPPDVFARSISRSRQLEVLDRLDIEPFVDIFRRGQSELKKSAVKFLGKIRSHAALRTLNLALMDEDIEVRLYAAGVLNMIEDKFASEIDMKKKESAAHPENSALELDLAEIYYSYARSGLLDEIARTYYYRETVEILSSLPPSKESDHLLARSSYALGEYGAAKDAAMRCIGKDENNPAYRQLLCDILFAMRDYDGFLDNLDAARRNWPPLLSDSLLTFWS